MEYPYIIKEQAFLGGACVCHNESTLWLVSPAALERGENRQRLFFHHQKKGEFLNANNSERHLPTKLLNILYAIYQSNKKLHQVQISKFASISEENNVFTD